jgi:hypothetical protein
MLFPGIAQHAHQLTITLRDQICDVLLARQVSTQPQKLLEFFDQLTQRCAWFEEQFIAVVEVCGFNDWLIRRSDVNRAGCCSNLSDAAEIRVLIARPPTNWNCDGSMVIPKCHKNHL